MADAPGNTVRRDIRALYARVSDSAGLYENEAIRTLDVNQFGPLPFLRAARAFRRARCVVFISPDYIYVVVGTRAV